MVVLQGKQEQIVTCAEIAQKTVASIITANAHLVCHHDLAGIGPVKIVNVDQSSTLDTTSATLYSLYTPSIV